MDLGNKTVVVYGAGGRLGAATAKELAAGGARCFLAGLDPGRLDSVAAEIRAAGGHAETAVLDVLDEAAVNDHADATAERAGRLDISAHAVSPGPLSPPLIDVPASTFVRIIDDWIASQLLTTRAVARHMIKQESGLILFLGGRNLQHMRPGLGIDRIGQAAVEALRRQWACELGPLGVRVESVLRPINQWINQPEWSTVP